VFHWQQQQQQLQLPVSSSAGNPKTTRDFIKLFSLPRTDKHMLFC
jgi:hypothetical protein